MLGGNGRILSSPTIVSFAALKLRSMYRAARRRKKRQFMHLRMAD